jgi:glycosyltransferase involved in cell wall biosynthesis
MAPAAIKLRWANRRTVGVPSRRLSLFPRLEWSAFRALRQGEPPESVYHRRNASFQRAIPDRWILEASHVVGFDTSSWILADRTRRFNRPFVLDQSIGHPRRKEQVFEEVRRRFPAWAGSVKPKLEAQLALEDKEHESASKIVAASSFSRQTLTDSGVPEGKIGIIPYGVDLAEFCPRAETVGYERPFRFIFVGLVNARKGVPVLLEAWRRMGDTGAELWLVGAVAEEIRSLIPALPGLRLLGPWRHDRLPALFHECDVFVFPSFFEGFGLVILEAMASGLPIIATPATAAPDLINDGLEGLMVPAGEAAMLATAMTRCLDDRNWVAAAGVAARTQAEDFPWSRYGDRWTALLSNLPADAGG